MIEADGRLGKTHGSTQERLEEQKGRHQGGKQVDRHRGHLPLWRLRYNPEGVRIGQDGSRNRSAVGVGPARVRNLDDSVELGTRNSKVGSKVRKFAREGAPEELDLEPHRPRPRQRRGPRPQHAARSATTPPGADVPRHRRLDGRPREAVEELFSAAKTEFSIWNISTSTTASTTTRGRTTAAGTPSAPAPSTSCTSTARL